MTASDSDASTAEFLALVGETPVKPGEIEALLDRMSADQRVAAIRSAGRRAQRRLYEACEGYGELRLVDLAPAGAADLATVRHYGRNTLPVFTEFEKRFCRPEGRDPREPGELYGFNFQRLAFVTGPGYFVAREDPRRREVLIDYRSVPPEAPPGWPAVQSNETGLARFVYGFMVDTLRRVSAHVTIGSAARKGKDLGSWFVLSREG